MLLVAFAEALRFPKWRHPQSVSYSLVHPTSYRTATTLYSSISSSLDDVSKRMKAIEWCLMTKGRKDEVHPIDIPDFVPFYENLNKDNLEKLYVDLQEEKTVLQRKETSLQEKETAIQEEKTALQRKETALQEEKSALSKAAVGSKGRLNRILYSATNFLPNVSAITSMLLLTSISPIAMHNCLEIFLLSLLGSSNFYR